jgi:glycerol kinase
LLTTSDSPERVEFDPAALAAAAIELGTAAIEADGAVDAVGITNHRCSTVVWDRRRGTPIGPGLGWQDRRTIARCGELAELGFIVSPNTTATKAEWLVQHALDTTGTRPDDVCVGTVDSWLVWTLSRGEAHITDVTNASSSGMWSPDEGAWSVALLDACHVPLGAMPAIVDSAGVSAIAHALPGAPPIAGIAGDQQASLVGQGCTDRGAAKLTFGTGGMLDVCLDAQRPERAFGARGTLAMVAWSQAGVPVWMREAVMLSCGSNIVWLRDQLGIIDDVEATDRIAAECPDSGGVVFVPALHGLGTPSWDFGARGTLFGITATTDRAHIVRAVLEGIAERAADLVEAAEADGEVSISVLGIDGGMTRNATFTAAVADAIGRPVDVAAEIDATVLGAAFLAGSTAGIWPSPRARDTPRAPTRRIEPRSRPALDAWRDDRRGTWREACRRAGALVAPTTR